MTKKQLLREIKALLANLISGQKAILSFNEAVIYLDVSSSFLYKCTSQGLIPYFKPNNKLIYFRKEDLDQFLQQNRIGSINKKEL